MDVVHDMKVPSAQVTRKERRSWKKCVCERKDLRQLGYLAASSLAVDRALAWETKDLHSSSTLSLSVCLALSKDLPLSNPPFAQSPG